MNMLIIIHDMYMMNLHVIDTIGILVSPMNMCWCTLLKYDGMYSQMQCNGKVHGS